MTPALVLAGGRWRFRFERQADRYGHIVEVSEGGRYQAVLQSVEGAADDAWPPSPPLQDLHIEERPGGEQVALLVGRAGRSHWSLSIELSAAADTVAFDAACRRGETPQWLGTTYRLLQPPPILSLANCGLGVAIEPVQGVDVRLDSASRELRLAANTRSAHATVRWNYRLAICESA